MLEQQAYKHNQGACQHKSQRPRLTTGFEKLAFKTILAVNNAARETPQILR